MERNKCNHADWIPVNKLTLQTKFENVDAIGDVVVIMLSNGKALPKADFFTEGQALTVSQRVIEDI